MKHKNISVSRWILLKSALIALLLLGVSFTSRSQIITTIAGNGSAGYSGDGGQATVADIDEPHNVALDASGNLYITDQNNNRIRKVNTSSVISTFVGNGIRGYSGDGGPASAADINQPLGVVVDASGNIYITLPTNQVRKINTSGIISAFAGNGTQGSSGDGGPATAAEFYGTTDIAVGTSGNVYIVDENNQRIRMVNTSGIISTVAGNGKAGYTGDGGQATTAELNYPDGLTVDASGNIYIAEILNGSIRKVSTSGIISTIAGNGATGFSGDGGPATAGELNDPTDVAVDVSGNVYIADEINRRIRVVNTSGIIATLAGDGRPSYSGDGGPAPDAELNNPTGITVDPSGNVYIADYANNRVRKVTSSFSVLGSAVNITCNGASTGSVSAVSYDGTGSYTYSWTPGGQTTSTATGLSAGIYTVTLTENGGATAITAVTVIQPNPVIVATTLTSPSCNPGSNGTASATASSGTSPYTYSWSGGLGTKSTASALSVGTYTITATDNCGASASATVTITQAGTIASISATTPSCVGQNNGTASALGSNGTAPYTYSWSIGGQTRSTASALSVGTYTVTITDKCGTSATASATITQATSVTASVSVTPSCNGQSNGIAVVTAFNGKAPYAYSWSGGKGAKATIKNLDVGTYTVTVTDNCGGSATASAIITQPNALSAGASATASCNGESNGTAMASLSGGTSPYTYSWSGGGGTNSTVSGLDAGIYTVTIQDSCGASASATATVTQPIALSATASAISNAGCGATPKGSVLATVGGGTTPYTYSWSPGGQTNAIATGLSAGIYTLTVWDSCGASATDTTNIQALTVTAFAGANVSCYGGSNGQAKVSANGGKAPFTYSWSPIANSTYILNGLSTGTYSVLVTDNHGCSGTSAVTITQPTVLRDSVATISYPTCSTPATSATIGVAGGTSPYRYTWSPNVSTTNSASGLLIRSYAVQVKDNNNCWNDLNFSISQPPPLLKDSVIKGSVVNASCSSNGSATVGVKYGVTPYTYSWSPAGGSGSTANGLSAGTYTITVNDAGLCTASTSVTIIQVIRPSLIATAYIGANVSCNGGSNGQAKVSVTGGSAPYTYSWNSGSNTYIANGLSIGTYTVTVTDNCGSSASSSATVTQPALLVDSVASVNDPPCTGGTGNATIGVIGGTSPYRYTWSPNVSSTDSASGLVKRSYVVQVKDNNNCWNNITISITSCANPPTATYPKGIHSDKGNNATCCPVPDNINLYPNPNTGQFTLSGLQKGMILEMYDYTGKKISSTTITNQTMQLNISQADGIYLIRILDKDGNLVSEKKVVKMQ